VLTLRLQVWYWHLRFRTRRGRTHWLETYPLQRLVWLLKSTSIAALFKV